MLATPDKSKRITQNVNDEDAEDVTHLVTTSYTSREVMQELIADASTEVRKATVNMIHVIATPAEAREWTEKNVNILDSEGYQHPPPDHTSCPQSQQERTRPSEDDENRWTYYQRPAGHMPSPPKSSEDNLDTGEDMEKLGDNDPFLSAMKEAGILSNQRNSTLDTIQEGDDTQEKQVRFYNDDLGAMENPHSTKDTKRYKGRRERDNRRHQTIMNAIQSAKGIYRVEMSLKLQHDSGANICVTNNLKLLVNVTDAHMDVNGCSDTGAALTCTKLGYLPWYSKTGERLLIKCYYSSTVSGTIISTSAIVKQYGDRYSGWSFNANQDNHIATLQLTARDGVSHTDFDLYEENLLWYHYLTLPSEKEYAYLNKAATAVCRTLSKEAEHELWHNRLGHPGTRIMQEIHKHVTGVPTTQANKFYRCGTCLHSKFRKNPIGKTRTKRTKKPDSVPPDPKPPPGPKLQPGQRFYCDFGFIRGSDWAQKDETTGKLVTSIDGMRSYFLMIDEATRYIWAFPTASKVPPIELARGVMRQFTTKYAGSTIRCDRGGELGRSGAFAKMVQEEGYLLQTTGSYSSAQNGMAEKPNQDLVQIVRSLLHGAGLGSEYWSYALRHAVYLKNRLPHTALNFKTPFEGMNKRQPDLAHLRVWGSRVHVKSKERNAKLDSNNTVGTFMTYSGTDKNIWALNNATRQPLLATHYTFDEAHMSTEESQVPPYAIALQRAGYRKTIELPPEALPEKITKLPMKLITEGAILPSRSTKESAGLDMYAAKATTLHPHTITAVPTGIATELPINTYAQIQSRSGLASKSGIFAIPGVIDSDYRGEIKILLLNTTSEPAIITKNQRIAQIIMHSIHLPTPEVTEEITTSERGTAGFGSTEEKENTIAKDITKNSSPTDDKIAQEQVEEIISIEDDDEEIISIHNKKNGPVPIEDLMHATGQTDTPQLPIRTVSPEPEEQTATVNATMSEMLIPYTIHTSTDIYDNILVRDMLTTGDHPTKGLVIQQCPHRNLPTITECKSGTAAAKLKKWRSTMRGAYILDINGIEMTCEADITSFFSTNKDAQVRLKLGTIEKQAMHPDDGVPIMYFDQLNMIAQHLRELKYGDDLDKESPQPVTPSEDNKLTATLRMLRAIFFDGIVPYTAAIKAAQELKPKSKQRGKKLTRRKLLQQDDWDDWKHSEWKQLDQYETQDTFGEPCILPTGANCLSLLWTYLIKDGSGIKKARCVCNGRPNNPGTVTWGHTYAKALDQVGHRVFWAAIAAKNFIVRGSDASNAFAEAPPPKHPLYVKVDTPYREWWISKGRPPIPEGYVMRVQKALQGHPESPRLWATLIHNILTKELGLTSTTHEQCLYHGQFKGKEVLFLRQVDDFACGAAEDATTSALISAINKRMKIEVKDLGILDRYNGVDIRQTAHYVHLSCEVYIDKIVKGHEWITDDMHSARFPIPMIAESKFSRQMEDAKAPEDYKAQIKLQHEMGIHYRQVIGELLYAMVTCRPDISYPVVKLSQYSITPAREHYEAAKQLLLYLKATKTDGIYYWRSTPHKDLPEGPLPTTKYDTHQATYEETKNENTLEAAVDSDWAADSKHRKSVSGIVLQIAGGAVLYKTKFQDTIALSSTQAEFSAACDAGKCILFVRSLLDEIGLPQDKATTLYIDNNGALLMANAQQPTRRTRHVEIKQFVLLEWVENDLLELQRITTSDNYSDGFTKPLGRILHYRHFDRVMGRIIPTYTGLTQPEPR